MVTDNGVLSVTLAVTQCAVLCLKKVTTLLLAVQMEESG